MHTQDSMRFTAFSKKTRGFTLLELLIVIGILGILMTTVLIAINPLRQIAQAKNTKRNSDTVAIINALQQYATDNGGTLPTELPETPTNVSKDGVDLCTALVPVYIAGLPVDPTLNEPLVALADCGTNYDTGYTVAMMDGQYVVAAPLAEYDEVIEHIR